MLSDVDRSSSQESLELSNLVGSLEIVDLRFFLHVLLDRLEQHDLASGPHRSCVFFVALLV